ncbi:hypothetical protein GCM10027614_49240 [Micromonospora vulcania]
MTTEGFREVDDDLLADYLGGALDGTPQQAEVAGLVDADPAWAQAYALLAPAVTAVSADLSRWAEPTPELPPAIADRLAAALAAAEPPPTGVPVDEDAPPTGRPVIVPAQGGSVRRPAGASPADPGRGTPTGPGRRRHRWARRTAPVVAVAAVAVVAIGLGLNQLAENHSDTAGTAAMDQPVSAPNAAVGAARTTGPPLHSGTDYSPQTLADGSALSTSQHSRSARAEQPPGVESEGAGGPRPTG